MKYLFAIALFLVAQTGFSQKEKSRKEIFAEIETVKIGMITSQLAFSTDQAEQFWPVYNSYSKEREGLRKKMRKLRKEDKNRSEAEIKKSILESLDLRQEEVTLERKYTKQLLEVLSPKQVIKLHRAEMKFKRMLLEKLGRRGGGKHGKSSKDHDDIP